ncbi:MAG: Ppx/GppA phosphatase family protein [Candidatus Dormibacteria bacterium]
MVATLEPAGLIDRLHAVRMVNLGHAVAGQGQLGEVLVEMVTATVAEMLELARGDGAEAIGLVATEAIRNSPDADALVAAVLAATGQTLRVVTGEAEARLSYLGATAFKVQAGEPATVADVGGGSTEVIHGSGTRPQLGSSLQLGSDQLLTLIGASDPPTRQQLAHGAARVSMMLEGVPRGESDGMLLATGGTASNVPVMLGLRAAAPEAADLCLQPETGPAWMSLTREQLNAALELVLSDSSGRLARQTGLSRRRSRLMAGGLIILVGLLDRYQLPVVTVTERGLRDGVVLAVAASRSRRQATAG